jgi:FHA domain
MNRKTALEFLDLSEPVSDRDIFTRLVEKQTYFTHLCDNAPNDFLKKLHEKNLEKILQIKNMLGIPPAEDQSPPSKPPGMQRAEFPDRPAGATYAGAQQPAAWLIRHTENQPAKTYALYPGKNIAGRSIQPNAKTVLVDDDPYVSNIHAVLEVLTVNPLKILVTDDAASNNGKPSRNGTYINGNEERIAKSALLGENDTVQIGYTKFTIRANNKPVPKMIRDVEESEFVKTVVINFF